MAIQINPNPDKAQAFKDALKGAVDRSLFKVEVYFSSALGWVDITPYVFEMSGIMEELSSVSGGASANTLNLTLINDDGRFSPKAQKLTDGSAAPYYGSLLPNKPIRISSVYGTDSVRMFTGYVSNWIPSAKQRNCQVTAEDAARILRRKDIVEETVFNPTAATAGYYLTRVFERAAWLSGLRWDTVNTRTDNGSLLSIAITAGGSAYTNGTYSLSFSGGGGSGASGSYVVSGGAVTAITITNPGSGYTSAPSVSFPSGGGSGAAASAAIVTSAWAASDHGAGAIIVNKTSGATKATYTQGGALVMTLDLIDLLIPVIPLKGKCLAVLDQLAKVVDGVVYFDAQGQLVFRARMYRNDSTLTSVEAFTVSSLEDVTAQTNFEDAKWSQLCNKATVKSTPWAFKVDASGNVVEEEIPFKGDLFAKSYFNPGERFPDYVADSSAADLWCEIPNGIRLFKTASPAYPSTSNMVLTSLADSDPTKKSPPNLGIDFQGGYPVFEQTRIKVALVNNASTAQRIENLSLKAKLMRPIQRCQSVQKNQDSIDLYDQRDREVSNDFIPNVGACKNLAAWLVEDGRQPRDFYMLPVMYGCPWLELGDKITVSETITNILPSAAEAIVRRISWRWSLAAFVFTIEACTPAATFTAGVIPASVANVDTSNQNQNGVQAGSQSPQAIDGTQNLVGLNNIPAFSGVTNRAKILSAGSGITASVGITFDGADIYVAQGYASGRVVNRIDNMTGASNWTANSLNASDTMYNIQASGTLLFATEITNNTIQVVSTTAASPAAFTSKAALGNRKPFHMFFIGGKMYVATCNTVTNDVEICVWNAINSTTQSTPDATYTLKSGGSTQYPIRGTTDGTSIYLPIGQKIAAFNTSTNAVTSDILAPSLGISPLALTWDGANLWVSYGTNVAKLVKQSSGFGLDLQMPSFAGQVGDMVYDGIYIWGSIGAAILQISTANKVLGSFKTNSVSGGFIVFDGYSIWQSDGNYGTNIYRVPRLATGRQF